MGVYCGCGRRKHERSRQCAACAKHTKRAAYRRGRVDDPRAVDPLDDRPLESDLSAAEIDRLFELHKKAQQYARLKSQGSR